MSLRPGSAPQWRIAKGKRGGGSYPPRLSVSERHILEQGVTLSLSHITRVPCASKQALIPSKEPCMIFKEPYMPSKEPCMPSKKPSTLAAWVSRPRNSENYNLPWISTTDMHRSIASCFLASSRNAHEKNDLI